MNSILNDPAAWDGWALDRHAAHELAAHLAITQPRVIVEAGSGASTILLAEHAARTGATVITLEHHPHFAAQTQRILDERDLSAYADIRLSHLTDVDSPDGLFPWYAAPVPHGIDFALVDGPPGAIGRHGAMFALHPHMRGDWQVWLDDAHRVGEAAAVQLWLRHLPVIIRDVDLPKGLTVIQPQTSVRLPPRVDASDVAVTLITGTRPDLLHVTINRLRATAPGLLETAWVAVMHNGGDPVTADLLDSYRFIDHRVTTDSTMPIGMTAAAMLGTPAPRPFTLHLEDDWAAATCTHGWLDRARAALADPAIGQVRLRHRGDTVLSKHMVSKAPIIWRDGPAGHVVGSAHYTLNPSLMRSEDTPKLWDEPMGERDAAQRFHTLGWLTAQAVPGVFRHIGGGQSLRLGQRR